MKTILLAGNSDVGRRRSDNQDTFICQELWSADMALLAVIDGVGGYAGGEVAAAIARESITKYMASPKGETLTMLREAIVFANNNIAEERSKNIKYAHMCCVLTAAVADAKSGKLFFVHVGDTRLYRFRKGMLEKLSKDHSVVGMREDAGDLSESEAMYHPRRNEIMREVGSMIRRVDDPDFLDYEETAFYPGDVLLVCSDGLTDMLTRAQILRVLTTDNTLEEQVPALIKMANEKGGNDNITVVLAKNLSPVLVNPVEAGIKIAGQLEYASNQSEQQAASLPSSTQNTPITFMRKNRGIAVLIALFIFASGFLSLWLWRTSREATLPAKTDTASNSIDTTTLPDSSKLQTDLAEAQKSRDRRWLLPAGTFTLAPGEFLVLKDSLIISGKGNIISPSDTVRIQPAFFLKRHSTIIIEDVVFKGFKTAIITEDNVHLQLKNVQFVNVITPAKSELKKDSIYNLQINILPTRPDTTKTN